MPSKDQTMRWKVDISQFKKNIADAKRQIQLANAEFKTATGGARDWASSMDGLEAKLKQLAVTAKNQRTVLDQLEQEYELVKREMGETSPAAERLRIQIENQRAAVAKTEKQTDTYSKALEEMAREQKAAETPMGKLNKTIEEQERELEDLKEQYKNAVAQYGKNSKEAKTLADQIDSLSGELKDNKSQVEKLDKAANDLDRTFVDTDKATDDLKDGFTVLKGAAANLLADGIRALVGGLKDLAKSTYEAGANFESEMSKVGAISGATADDMDKLRKKAKEMGASTKFTATEAGEALEYMAMAGWKTDDMLNGLEGIMSLAAASGEDLGTTSDIVTDALTAFGMEAKDAGHFADVLAAASSNANTNVSMMGESFKYVAPVAGSLGFSVEDVSVALGLMANSGIKASTAGTTLRQILNNMAKPTDTVAAAMQELGVSLDDGQGNMNSLAEIMDDLREGFKNTKIPMDEFQSLVQSLDRDLEDGTITEEDYNTQLEYLAEKAYGAEGALKAQAAASLAGTRGMAGLLAIVNTSEEDYNKLTKAINNCEGAAGTMAQTMQDNVAGKLTILQSKIEGIMIDLFDAASDSMKDGIDTVSDALDKIDWDKAAEGLGNLAEGAANLFAYIVDHSDEILSILKAIAVAFVTYKAVEIITGVVGAFTSLHQAIKTADGVMAVFNNTLSLNPIGLVAAALGGLVMVALDYRKSLDDAKESLTNLSEEEKAFIDQASETAKAYEGQEEARRNNNLAIDKEFGYYADLIDELDDITYSNGKVKEGYEERAKFIVGELQEATGAEIKMLDDQILNYQALKNEIKGVIEEKRREAIVSANAGAYEEAINNQVTAYRNYKDAMDRANDTQEKLKVVQKEYSDLLQQSNNGNAKSIEAMGMSLKEYNEKVTTLQNEEQALTNDLNAQKQAVADTEAVYHGYMTTIQNYEGVQAAMASGDVDVLNDALLNLQYGLKTTTTASKTELEQQAADFDALYKRMKEDVEVEGSGVTQQMVDSMAEMSKRAHDELDKANGVYKEDAKENVKSYVSEWQDPAKTAQRDAVLAMTNAGIDAVKRADYEGAGKGNVDDYMSTWQDPAKEQMRNAALAMTNDGIDAIASADFYTPSKTKAEEVTKAINDEAPVAGSAAEAMADNMASGIETKLDSWKNRIFSKMRELVRGAINAGNDEADIHSPSKETAKIGRFMALGLAAGLESETPTAEKTAANVIRKLIDKIQAELDKDKIAKLVEKEIRQVEKLTQSGKLSLVDELRIWQETVDSIQKGTKAYKNAKKELTATRKELNAELKNLQTSYANDIKAVYAEMNTSIAAARENYESQIASIRQSFYKTYGLFDEAKVGEGTSAKSLIRNLEDQISAMNDYTDTIEKINKRVRGFDDGELLYIEDFLVEIESMGIDQLGNLQAIANMTDKQLRQYLELFDEKNVAAEFSVGQSTREVLKNAMADSIDEARYKAADSIGSLSATLKKELRKVGLDTSSLMKDIGGQIVAGLDDGVTSSMKTLTATFSQQVKDLVKATKIDLGIASPSKVFAQEIGRWIPAGIAEGFKLAMPYSEEEMKESLYGAMSTLKTGISGASAAIGGAAAGSGGGRTVVFNQYNNSPKALDRLTIYRETNSLLFSAKARLA